MKHKGFLEDYLKLKKDVITELNSLLKRFPDKSVDMPDSSVFLCLCPGGAIDYDIWQVLRVTDRFILIKNKYEQYEAEYDDFSVLDLEMIMDNMPEPE